MTDEKSYPTRPEGISPVCLPKRYPRELKKDSIDIAKYLVKLVKEEGPNPTTYKETGGQIGLKQNDPALFMHLGTISWVTYHNEKVFLSVLVAREDEKIPGNGFFKMVAKFRKRPYKESTNDNVFIDELNGVYEAAKEGKLDFILTGKTLK